MGRALGAPHTKTWRAPRARRRSPEQTIALVERAEENRDFNIARHMEQQDREQMQRQIDGASGTRRSDRESVALAPPGGGQCCCMAHGMVVAGGRPQRGEGHWQRCRVQFAQRRAGCSSPAQPTLAVAETMHRYMGVSEPAQHRRRCWGRGVCSASCATPPGPSLVGGGRVFHRTGRLALGAKVCCTPLFLFFSLLLASQLVSSMRIGWRHLRRG